MDPWTVFSVWIVADLGVGLLFLKGSAKAIQEQAWSRALLFDRWTRSPLLPFTQAFWLVTGLRAVRDLARGSLLIQAGRLDEAEQSLRRAVRRARKRETAWTAGMLLERVLLELGDVEAAVKQAERLELDDPDDPVLRARRLQLHAESGNWEAAERDLRLLSSHPPHFDECESRLALWRGQWARALAAARRSRANATPQAGLHAAACARAALEAGEPGLASEWLRDARGSDVAAVPSSSWHAVAAAAAAACGQPEIARAEIARSLAAPERECEFAGTRALRLRMLVGAHLDLGDAESAAAIADRPLEPATLSVHRHAMATWRGRAWEAAGRRDDAVRAYRDALAAGEGHAWTEDARARLARLKSDQ